MKLRPLNKKGITISTPTIVITILAILVLLVVALSFKFLSISMPWLQQSMRKGTARTVAHSGNLAVLSFSFDP